MRNMIKEAALILVLVSSLVMPSFASAAPEAEETNVQKLAADDAASCAASEEAGNSTVDCISGPEELTCAADADEAGELGDNAAAEGEKEAEVLPCKDDEEAGEERVQSNKAEKEDDEEDGITLVSYGEGRLKFQSDGSVVCKPDAGCETVSITADKDAEDIKAGRQIPELEISEISFEDDTTITAVFRRDLDEDCLDIMPASANAVFGSQTAAVTFSRSE